jgi:hypothetical protein
MERNTAEQAPDGLSVPMPPCILTCTQLEGEIMRVASALVVDAKNAPCAPPARARPPERAVVVDCIAVPLVNVMTLALEEPTVKLTENDSKVVVADGDCKAHTVVVAVLRVSRLVVYVTLLTVTVPPTDRSVPEPERVRSSVTDIGSLKVTSSLNVHRLEMVVKSVAPNVAALPPRKKTSAR